MMRSRFLAVSLLGCLLAASVMPSIASAQAPPQQASTSQPTTQQTAQAGGSAPDWLAGDVGIVFTDLTHAAVSGQFDIHKTTYSGSTKTAQDLRATYANAASHGVGELFVAGVEGGLAARLTSTLQDLFPGATVDVKDARIDRATLTVANGPDAYHPPVRFGFNATLLLNVADLLHGSTINLTEDTLRTALDVGATLHSPYALTAQPGWNVTFAFTLPRDLQLDGAPGGTLNPDGSGATWDLRNWQASTTQLLPVDIALRGRGAPKDPATDAHLDLVLDMDQVSGLSIPGALHGDFGQLDVLFSARMTARSLRVADVPALRDQLEARLPASVNVTGFNADGLRLAVQKGLVPASAIAQMEAAFQKLATDRVSAIAGGAVDFQGGFAPGSLDAANISTPLNGDPPLVYEAKGAFRIPLSTASASKLSAAVGPILYTKSLTFHLPRLQGMETGYRVVLPPGIALQDVQVSHATARQEQQDGRDAVVITPTDDQAEATFQVAVSSEFALTQFWYVWLGVLLVIALGAAVVIMRRRGREPDEPL